MKRNIRLYNVMFPLWMILLIAPTVWIFVIPGNFIIDSIVLVMSLYAMKIADKRSFYKKSIVSVFLSGLLADFIGSLFAFCLIYFFELGSMGDEFYITVPSLVISMCFIYILNYFISFKRVEGVNRRRLSLVFALVTAPYTFLVPSAWIYN